MVNMKVLMNYESALARAGRCKTMAAALAVIDEWARAEFKDHRRKVTDEMIGKILEMYAADESPSVIAEEVGLSGPTVRKLYNQHKGTSPDRWKGRGPVGNKV